MTKFLSRQIEKMAEKQMRELDKMPHNEAALRNHGVSRFKKRPHKIDGKNLGDAIDSVSEDCSPASSKESINVSSVSGISKLNGNGDFSSQSFSPVRVLELSASSPVSLHSELTQASEIISLTNCGVQGVGDSNTNSLEAMIATNFLRKAVTQVSNSDMVDSHSKKLLYTLVEMVIQMLQTVPEEKDGLDKLLMLKTQIVCAFCLFCIFATVAMLLFCRSGSQSFSGKPLPT